MTDERPTAADEDLLSQVADLGQKVTWRQLKRWRDEGLVASPDRPGAGRGKGRPSRGYPAGTDRVVARVAEVIRVGNSLQDAALDLFLHDLPVREDVLRKALLAALDVAPELDAESDLDRRADLAADLTLTAKRTAKKHPLKAHWNEQSHGEVIIGPEWDRRRARPPEITNNALLAIASPIFTSDKHEEGHGSLAHILGLNVDEMPAVVEALLDLTVDRLREAVRHEPISHLRRGVTPLRDIFGNVPDSSPARPNYQAAAIAALAFAVALKGPRKEK